MRFVLLVAVLGPCGCGSFADARVTAEAGAPVDDAGSDAGSDAGDAGAPPVDPTLLAHWKLDGLENSAVKESVRGRDGLVIGPGKFVAGRIGNAFSTENGMASITVGNVQGLSVAKQFTIAMWISLQESPNDSWFYVHGDQFALKLNGRRPQLYVGPDFYWAADFEVPASQWRHVAATFDSGAVKIYVDGVQTAEKDHAFEANEAPESSAPIVIGAAGGGGSPALGLIDDVRVWNRVLPESEIDVLVAAQ